MNRLVAYCVLIIYKITIEICPLSVKYVSIDFRGPGKRYSPSLEIFRSLMGITSHNILGSGSLIFGWKNKRVFNFSMIIIDFDIFQSKINLDFWCPGRQYSPSLGIFMSLLGISSRNILGSGPLIFGREKKEPVIF